ncbi:MAG: AAA family ATPase [Patescibacteria group bacterium]
MPAEFPKEYVAITCPSCNGTGMEAEQRCALCRGRGEFAWLGGQGLTWTKNINRLTILEDQMERIVTSVMSAILIVIGIAGILFAFVTVMETIQSGGFPWEAFTVRNGYMAFFALSLITDLYAYSRIDRESRSKHYVQRREFDIPKTLEHPDELFAHIAGADEKNIVDVSHAFDLQAHKAVEQAWVFVQRLKHRVVMPLHLFATLLAYPDIRIILARLGISPSALGQRVSHSLQHFVPPAETHSTLGPDIRKVFLAAYREAFMTRREKVSVSQLFTATAESAGQAQEILYDLEVELSQVQNVVEWSNMSKLRVEQLKKWRRLASHKPSGAVNRSYTSLATPLLDRFSHDLTHLTLTGALPLSIGREKELDEAFRIIESGKGNPLFVGNPGVGKQSIVEQIAALMASEEVPEVLQDKRLISLSIASLVGAAGRQGELEGRLMQLINEIVRAGNIAVVVDNVQNMVGVSTEGSENMDIAAIFAQALEQRLFVAIGTTTPQDYRRYIEPSGSLMRVFQRVHVEEPGENETIRILESKVGVVEYKNGVFFSYRALEQIARLSQRYIQDRFQPEKAIMILEETGVHVHKKKGKNALVTADDVAEVVSSRTNVPVTRVTQKESEKLLNLEQRIHERVIGQNEAVVAVSTALRRARAELRDVKRPIANLLFLGPTGVGKTELAKTVADVYFGSENMMIRLDMSEYQEQSSINRLIGAPPGYGSEGGGGYLTEAVRANPFSLVLLDELEKAHPDILNIFLQVMDDGRLTDTTGRTIDFTNAIIIATSNAGSLKIQEGIQAGQTVEQIKNVLMNQELNKYFRPEFLNRFDGVIVFKPLTFDEIMSVVQLLLKQVGERLSSKGISLRASEDAVRELATVGFDPVFGARPLRRAIQERVDNALASYLLQGKIGRRDVAVLEPGGQIRVERAAEF